MAYMRRMMPELRAAFDLGRITVPVLLIWGDHDRLVSHRGAQQILAAVPTARLELLHGVGHCPQVEAPERFTELLLEFADARPEPSEALTGRAGA